MIEQGQWTDAQTQLAEVSVKLQSMNDGAARRDLMDEVNLLNVRVGSRNPNATVPASATKLPADSTTPNSPTRSTKPPTVASTTSPSMGPATSTSPSPSSGRHRHHSHTPTPTP
jgi:hypothetical protein